MKCSELWLKQIMGHAAWQKIQASHYPDLLTLGGLEVESREPVAPPLDGVVIGQVVSLEKHKEAKRLSVCQVDIGKSSLLTIVCGAANVASGLRVAVATVGTLLPGNKQITQAVLRGVESNGMLCAASEIGLLDEADGIMILPVDAPIGVAVSDYLLLHDTILELSITPNRGDCLSVLGIARELAALADAHQSFVPPIIEPVPATIQDALPVNIENKVGCPRYVGRIIKNINPNVKTPFEMKVRLERSGVRSINPIVDVTNYVMLELGQPMHAFDLAQLSTGIVVRDAKPQETLTLLDESEVTLHADTMMIADHEKPLAIAGIMGGLHSGISSTTNDIFLESAYFDPSVIARQRQYYGIQSESLHRFERGVDPTLQERAIHYATSLILDICGGLAGPLTHVKQEESLPEATPVILPLKKVSDYLGLEITPEEIRAVFTKLNMQIRDSFLHADQLSVTPPAYRFDIKIPEDLIEEIARVHGYHHIPTHMPEGPLALRQVDAPLLRFKDHAKSILVAHGFHEIITYSFVEDKKQLLLNPHSKLRYLTNPIVLTMNVMRTNLWPGLIDTLLYNQSRQQKRNHFFEIGTVFLEQQEATHLAGLMSGLLHEEQWGYSDKQADFFDIKGSLQNLLSTSGIRDKVSFDISELSVLHPGQQAAIHINQTKVGHIGRLHPALAEQLDVLHPVYLFELYLDQLSLFESKKMQSDISRFPEVRRDIAILVDRTIPCAKIQDTIKKVAGDNLKEVFVFDVYEGDNIPPHLKSIAFAIMLQAMERTLIDEEVTAVIDHVTSHLKQTYGAELRS